MTHHIIIIIIIIIILDEDLDYNQMYTFVFNHGYKFFTLFIIKNILNQN